MKVDPPVLSLKNICVEDNLRACKIIQDMTSNLGNLLKLQFNDNSLSERQIHALVAGTSTLVEIEITNCADLYDDHILTLCSKNPKLEAINISWCSNL